MAHALGRTERRTVLARFQTDGSDADPVQQTVPFVHPNGSRLTAMGWKSFVRSIADDLGLFRSEAQCFEATSRHLDRREIDALAADWIIYAGQGDDVDLIRGLPGWNELSAVQENRAIEVA